MHKITLLWIIFSRVVFSNELKDVLSLLEKSYREVKTIECAFEQTVQSPFFSKQETQKGKLWVSRPHKMKWVYESEKKTFLADGQHITLVDEPLGQANQSLQPTGEQMPLGMGLLFGLASIEKLFSAEFIGQHPGKVFEIKLTPKESIPNVKSVVLKVKKGSTLQILSTQTTDDLGGMNVHTFKNIVQNKKISPKTFELKLPKGVVLVAGAMPGQF